MLPLTAAWPPHLEVQPMSLSPPSLAPLGKRVPWKSVTEMDGPGTSEQQVRMYVHAHILAHVVEHSLHSLDRYEANGIAVA